MSRLRLASATALMLALIPASALADNGGRGPSGGDFSSSYGPYARPGLPPPRTWEEFYAQQNAAGARAPSDIPVRRGRRR